MTRPLSLRMRLTLIILPPLLAIATLAGLWQVDGARRTAADVFDRSLLSAALAVSNDVTLSGGDALSPRTRQLLADTSGGLVYYHVYGPDGVIVAGYATPPVGVPRSGAEDTGPRYFDASYLGRRVSGVRLQNRAEIEGFSGVFTTTVWQETGVRDAFVRDLVLRSLGVIFGLIASVALVVWFGVRVGLRPLLDLQDAIEQRSSDELSPIRRPVPEEVRGVVGTLNALFTQVSRSMATQTEFISNAAHQLRNPIAGVMSLAEAVSSAPSHAEAKARAGDLLTAARETADLAHKLLTLERAKALSPNALQERIDLDRALGEWVRGVGASSKPDVAITFSAANGLGEIVGDPTMLREALANLIDNALRHGGPSLSRIEVAAERVGEELLMTVSDNGRGIAAADIPKAMERFSQLSTASGSGLGLPIVNAIVAAHGGAMRIEGLPRGLKASLRIPIAKAG